MCFIKVHWLLGFLQHQRHKLTFDYDWEVVGSWTKGGLCWPWAREIHHYCVTHNSGGKDGIHVRFLTFVTCSLLSPQKHRVQQLTPAKPLPWKKTWGLLCFMTHIHLQAGLNDLMCCDSPEFLQSFIIRWTELTSMQNYKTI